VIEALKNEGCGVLTEINVQVTLKAKLGGQARWPSSVAKLGAEVRSRLERVRDALG